MSAFPDWLLRASLQASVLTLIVLAVQWAFRGKLNARWRYAFWFLVLARLALPLPPSSPVSLFNYVRTEKIIAGVGFAPVTPPPVSEAIYHSPRDGGTESSNGRVASPWASVRNWFRRGNIITLCALIWAAGVIVFTARLLGRTISFHRLLGRPPEVTDPETLALFFRCKAELGVAAPIRLCETRLVKSPALHGFREPRLLLPAGIVGRFSASELRHVFLHELAHVKQRDMVFLWLVTFLQTLHWFNPVLLFGFRRMAEDRELACDEMVLSHAGGRESGLYGETILKLLESYSQPAAVPGLMGILEDQTQIKRRISLIARFKPRACWSAPAMGLLLAVGLVTLTDAQPEQPGAAKTQIALRASAKVAAARDTVEQGVNILRLLAAGDFRDADWHHNLNASFEKLDHALLANGNQGGVQPFVEQGLKILREMIDYFYPPGREADFDDPWDD